MVEDLGGPLRYGTTIEGDSNFLIRPANSLDVIGKRNGLVRFISEEIAARVVLEGTLAVFGCISKVPDVAIALEDQIRTRREIRKVLPGRVIGGGRIPNLPQRGFRRTCQHEC